MNTNYNNSIVFTMRFKPELHKILKTMAEQEKRSIAKQIEYMLEKVILEKETFQADKTK